ncbi:MAG TPA: 3-deoxy-7-phosphoheptulonate synthase [Firmicutes bacterium]|nr:3-deoxy-7-phosphoheptulonate synthase [Bacillota bacterium]
MIIVMLPGATHREVDGVVARIEAAGLRVHVSRGEERTIIGAVGDVRRLEPEALQVLPGVERVVRILHPFKLASREWHPEPSVVKVGDVEVGGDRLAVIAGPCSVEGEEMLVEAAKAVKAHGASILRGGAFKPRTSPYSFQGLGVEGLRMLAKVGKSLNMPVATEVLSEEHVGIVAELADCLQIGARNMQNFALLQEVGRTGKPVILKRGLMSSVDEWLQAAEYILSEGNHKVILCERGIRTFETYTRNTLDLSAVPLVKKLSHLPVIVDPSHATGRADLVGAMSKAAIAAGADGLLIEVHPDPPKALSDGQQSLRPDEFGRLMGELERIASAIGRPLTGVCHSGSGRQNSGRQAGSGRAAGMV